MEKILNKNDFRAEFLNWHMYATCFDWNYIKFIKRK